MAEAEGFAQNALSNAGQVVQDNLHGIKGLGADDAVREYQGLQQQFRTVVGKSESTEADIAKDTTSWPEGLANKWRDMGQAFTAETDRMLSRMDELNTVMGTKALAAADPERPSSQAEANARQEVEQLASGAGDGPHGLSAVVDAVEADPAVAYVALSRWGRSRLGLDDDGAHRVRMAAHKATAAHGTERQKRAVAGIERARNLGKARSYFQLAQMHRQQRHDGPVPKNPSR